MKNSDDVDHFGFVTIATGPSMYQEMAVDLALSVKAFHADPFILLTDQSGHASVSQRYPGVFDRIIVLPEGRDRGFISKCVLAEQAPLQHAVFIDSDCLAVKPIDQLRTQALAGGMSMIGEMLHQKDFSRKRHNHARIDVVCARFGVDRFFRNHGAVYAYERHAAAQVMRDAETVYRALKEFSRLDVPYATDEIAYGVAAGRHGVRPLAAPRPIHWTTDLVQIPDGSWFKPLVHFHGLLSRQQRGILFGDVASRRRSLGFDVQPGVDAWKLKLKRNFWRSGGHHAAKWITMRLHQLKG